MKKKKQSTPPPEIVERLGQFDGMSTEQVVRSVRKATMQFISATEQSHEEEKDTKSLQAVYVLASWIIATKEAVPEASAREIVGCLAFLNGWISDRQLRAVINGYRRRSSSRIRSSREVMKAIKKIELPNRRGFIVPPPE